ncbi:unnamed protein product, partial [Prorocentrum cordatum]
EGARGDLTDHVRAVAELDLDFGAVCDMFTDPEQRRRWDALFGQQMQVIESDGDTFVSTAFPGFMGVAPRTFLSWHGAMLFDPGGVQVATRAEAAGQAMLWRPADVDRPGLPAKDGLRDESCTLGVVAERAGDEGCRLVFVLRAVPPQGEPGEPAAAIAAAAAALAPPGVLPPLPIGLYRRSARQPLEPHELLHLRKIADAAPSQEWQLQVDSPNLRIHHCLEEIPGGEAVTNHMRLSVELDGGLEAVVDLLEDPDKRRSWDVWFSQNMRYVESRGRWFLAHDFVGLPGVLSRSVFVHWYAAQLYDAAGRELLAGRSEDAFCRAALWRPADAEGPGLPSKQDPLRDESVSCGMVVERDICQPAGRSRLTVVVQATNYFSWVTMSKYLGPALMREFGILWAGKLRATVSMVAAVAQYGFPRPVAVPRAAARARGEVLPLLEQALAQRADGAWLDINNRHTQAVQAVVRLKKQLGLAQEKQQRLAEELAETVLTKKQAATILATREGVATGQQPSAPRTTAAPASGKFFGLKYDRELFGNLQDLECEESERLEFDKVHEGPIKAQTFFDGKAEQCAQFITRATKMWTAIAARLAKKRRGADWQAAPATPGGAPTGTPRGEASAPQAAAAAAPAADAAGAEDSSAARVAAEAQRISEAKFAAQEQAAKAGVVLEQGRVPRESEDQLQLVFGNVTAMGGKGLSGFATVPDSGQLPQGCDSSLAAHFAQGSASTFPEACRHSSVRRWEAVPALNSSVPLAFHPSLQSESRRAEETMKNARLRESAGAVAIGQPGQRGAGEGENGYQACNALNQSEQPLPRAPHSADRLRINQVRKVLTAFFPALSCKEVQWVLDLKDGQTDITFQEFAKKLSSLQEKSKGDDWDPVAAFTALSGSSGSTPDAPTLDFERFRDVWAQLGVNCVDEEVARQLIGRVLRRDLSSGPVTLDDFSRLCRLAMPMDATGRMEDNGSTQTCWQRTFQSMWKAYFGNCASKVASRTWSGGPRGTPTRCRCRRTTAAGWATSTSSPPARRVARGRTLGTLPLRPCSRAVGLRAPARPAPRTRFGGATVQRHVSAARAWGHVVPI